MSDYEELVLDVVSSPNELKEFLKSSIYQDFKNMLRVNIERFRDILEDHETPHAGRTYDFIRGGLFNMRLMQRVFEDFYEEAETEQERKEEEADGKS